MIRILVVGDLRLPGGDLAALLEQDGDIRVVGQVALDSDLVSMVVARSASVVLINVPYMVSQVLPFITDLRARSPYVGVLMLTDPGKPGMLPTRRRSLGISFLARHENGAALAATARRVAGGETVVEPRLVVAGAIERRLASTRELEVLALAAEGSTVREIADRLYLARGTVRNYLSAVIYKTGARNRIDAIRIARRDGWLY